MNSSNLLPVHERFYAFQGEGLHSGRAAFFIRLYGCPVHCPWCDSAGTWHPNFVPAGIQRMSVEELVAEVSDTQAEFVVITGGEPTVHNLVPLIDALHKKDFPVHLETSGTFPIPGNIDWVTLSPKRWRMPRIENYQCADEFKIIVEAKEDITFYLEPIQNNASRKTQRVVWLHPEWSKRNDPNVLDAISGAVMGFPSLFRAGYQLHKLYKVDALDNRSKTPVPLGGDPAKGF